MIFNEHDQIIKNPAYIKKEIEEIVKMVRLELYNRDLCCRAKAIKKKIGRIL